MNAHTMTESHDTSDFDQAESLYDTIPAPPPAECDEPTVVVRTPHIVRFRVVAVGE